MTTCKRCVMDESDPLISFDESGLCSRCQAWEKKWAEKQSLEPQFSKVIERVKRLGRNRIYDAVLGMSGGADSSWVYHIAKSNGLRVYVVHFDNGYDMPVATRNVQRLVDYYGDEVHTIAVNGEQFRQLQLAFLRSGTTGPEIPTDHAIKAVTYRTAWSMGIDVILNGTNIATESHSSPAWTCGHADWKYIRGIGERFKVDLADFPHYSFLDLATWMRDFWWLSLLDYSHYVRVDAIEEMHRLYGYESYGFKHQESRITRFLHGYIIPRRFGWDTRRSRLSAMICSGQMNREDALKMLSEPAYPESEMEEDKMFLCKRLGITLEDFESLMALPLKHYEDYPNSLHDPFPKILHYIKRLLY